LHKKEMANSGKQNSKGVGSVTNAKTLSAEVDARIATLAPDLKRLAQEIRKTILETDPLIGEQIKWNSPAFYYTGNMKAFDPKEYKRDLIVINLHRGKPLLVFPTGATIADSGGFLEGTYNDGRRILTIADEDDFEKKKDGLQSVIRKWLGQIEKA
jgi:hypothetical protein